MQFPVFLLLIAAALVFQTTVLEFLAVAGVTPDLVLLLVVLNGFLLGPREGAFLGFAGGIVEDLFSGSYIGLYALSNLIAGYLAGMAGERLYRENVIVASGVTFFSVLAGMTVNYLLLFYLGIHVPPAAALLRVELPTALYTTVLAPFIFWSVLRSVQLRGKDL